MPRIFFNSVVGSAVIIIAALQLVGWFTPEPESVLKESLEDVITDGLEGWTYTALPLAATEAVSVSAENQLRFDDMFNGAFERGETEVKIYVSYWAAGSMPYDLAGYHSPDVCWVRIGWQREEREYEKEGAFAGRGLKPYEYGVYSFEGDRQEVIFWHLVGGEPNRYEGAVDDKGVKDRFERLLYMFKDAKNFGFGSPFEQFFIRVTSNRSFEELWEDPSFNGLMLQLAPLGIFRSQ